MAVLGCIADDFTGASDAASFLVKGGMSVRLYNGIPEEMEINGGNDTQAIVIALKSRTQETGRAVAHSLEAARFLLGRGVKQIYFKYCSTFDSTPKGNIGPVADALTELMKVPFTLLCPGLPVNGRTVEQGRLLVNGIPLHESHMKNHPLTPMWNCRIDKLMEPQSRYRCRNLPPDELESFSFSPQEHCSGTPFYIIPDYIEPDDGGKIAAVFGRLPLLTGASGLLEPLAQLWSSRLSEKGTLPKSRTEGKAILLAGSCSKATLEQIIWYQKQGNPSCKLDPAAMLQGQQTVEDVWRFTEENNSESRAVLVYSSDPPEKVKEYQAYGTVKVSGMLESAMAQLAMRAVRAGYTKIICAGGETSGAVTKGLGFASYWIGESVAPGIPVMVPAESPHIRLVLKSGNFGQEDFFGRALAMTQECADT